MSARPRWRGIARALGAWPSSIRIASFCRCGRDWREAVKLALCVTRGAARYRRHARGERLDAESGLPHLALELEKGNP